MRTIFFFLLSFTLTAKPLQIAVVNIPPFINAGNNQAASGLMIQYLKQYLFQDLEVEWKIVPFARVLTDIDRGELDGFVPLIMTEERSKKVIWLGQTFLTVHPVVCHFANEYPRVIAVLPGSPIPQEMKAAGIQRVAGINYVERSLKMLKAGRVQGVYHPMGLTIKEMSYRLGYKDLVCDPIKSTTMDTRPALGKHVDVKLINKLNSRLKKAISFPIYLKKNINKRLLKTFHAVVVP